MLFKHRHWWRRTSELQKVFVSNKDKPTFCFFVEQCRCGQVRTVELHPEKPPIIRYAQEHKAI